MVNLMLLWELVCEPNHVHMQESSIGNILTSALPLALGDLMGYLISSSLMARDHFTVDQG